MLISSGRRGDLVGRSRYNDEWLMCRYLKTVDRRMDGWMDGSYKIHGISAQMTHSRYSYCSIVRVRAGASFWGEKQDCNIVVK